MLWALAVGYAQVYVGVHFPFDVVAGAALGTAIGMFVAALYHRKWSLTSVGLAEVDTINL
jgi:undecaprenyl-diphosphatase